MDDLEEQLPSAGVEDEDSSIDRLSGEVALEGLRGRESGEGEGEGEGEGGVVTVYLVDGDTVDISVVHKPDDLVGEQLSIVL